MAIIKTHTSSDCFNGYSDNVGTQFFGIVCTKLLHNLEAGSAKCFYKNTLKSVDRDS